MNPTIIYTNIEEFCLKKNLQCDKTEIIKGLNSPYFDLRFKHLFNLEELNFISSTKYILLIETVENIETVKNQEFVCYNTDPITNKKEKIFTTGRYMLAELDLFLEYICDIIDLEWDSYFFVEFLTKNLFIDFASYCIVTEVKYQKGLNYGN